MHTVFEVADYFLAKNNPSGYDDPKRITPITLQKLVYYAQGYALAILGQPLFGETIKAWDYGPVCGVLYHKYKDREAEPLDQVFEAAAEAEQAAQAVKAPLTEEEADLLDNVLACYREYSAYDLIEMTHNTAPWKEAYSVRRNEVITVESMSRFFIERLKGIKIEVLPMTQEEADRLAAETGLIPE